MNKKQLNPLCLSRLTHYSDCTCFNPALNEWREYSDKPICFIHLAKKMIDSYTVESKPKKIRRVK